MHRSPRRSSRLAASAAALMALTLGATACGSDGSSDASDDVSSSKPCGTDEDTTLTVGLFGTFGFKENGLYDEYKKECPNITIKEDVVTQSADYWTRLKTRLASGSGLADVQAIEIGFVADVVKNHSDQFVNFNDVDGAEDIKNAFYDWKWEQASSSDGKTTVGLGTDIGPEAICYRSDLLEQAGYSADPAELAKRWSTWEDFIAFGKEYKQKTDKAFVDSAASIFSTAVYQGDEAYSDEEGERHRRGERRRRGSLELREPGSRGRDHRRTVAVLGPVEQGILERLLRGDRLPDVDDGLHPGPGRSGRRRQVERGSGASGRRHQLGRLLARCADRGQEQGCGRRAGEVALREGAAGHDVDLEGAGRALPVQQRGR